MIHIAETSISYFSYQCVDFITNTVNVIIFIQFKTDPENISYLTFFSSTHSFIFAEINLFLIVFQSEAVSSEDSWSSLT